MAKPRVCFFACILLIFCNLILTRGTLFAQSTKQTEEPFYKIYEQAVSRYHHGAFEEAIRLATVIREKYPNEPAGAFGLMTTYQTIMRNYRVRRYDSKIDSLLELTVKMAIQATKKNKKDGRSYFYLGCAYGSRSIYSVSRGEWFKALRDASQVTRNFKKAIAYSPEFYDAYYGLGLYQYWLGAKGKFLRALPFARDKRKEGIEKIKLVLEKGRFLKVDSMYGLAAIYYNEEEFEKSLELSDQLYAKFPSNPSLLYRRGRTFQQLEKWQEAKETFAELSKILETAEYQSISFQIDCLFQSAKCAYQLNNILEARGLCQKASDLRQDCDFEKELDGPLEKFSEITEQLQTLNSEMKAINISEASAAREE